jgi:hypothetical protein
VLAPPAARARERERAAAAAAELTEPPQRSSAVELLTPSKRAQPDGDHCTGAREASGGEARRGAPRLVLPTMQRGGGPYSEFGAYFEGELTSSLCARAPWPARVRRALARARARARVRVLPTRVRPARGSGGLAYACVCAGKIRKLRESVAGKQLEAQTADEGSCTIFRGVCVWVDGFTSPSHAEIQTLMVSHARPPPPTHRLP